MALADGLGVSQIDVVCSSCAGQVQGEASVRVLRQALDQQRLEGRAALQLLDGARQVQAAVAEPGKGALIDRQA